MAATRVTTENSKANQDLTELGSASATTGSTSKKTSTTDNVSATLANAGLTGDVTTKKTTSNVTRAVADTVTAQQKKDAQKDLDANPELVEALATANLHPTAEGVSRVQQAINANASAWKTVTDAGKTVVATGGGSPAANKALGAAMSSFIKSTGIRTTDTSDLAYLQARAMLKSDTLERDDTMRALQAALDQAKAQLAKLTQQRDEASKAMDTPPVQQSGGGGKKDDSSDNSGAQQQAAIEAKQQQAELKSIDEQILQQNQLISELSASIAGGGAAGTNSQQNNEMVNEAILAMAEQANAISNLNAAVVDDSAKTNDVGATRPTGTTGTNGTNLT